MTKANKEVVVTEEMKQAAEQTAAALAEQEQVDTSGGEQEVKVEEKVTLKLRKTATKRFVNTIVSANEGVHLEETEDAYILTGQHIRVTRADAETILGKLTDGRWKMLFINRTGEVREFNNYEFLMAITKPIVQQVTEQVEMTQMNVRIPKSLKDAMDTFRAPDLLDLSQNDFVTEALYEYINTLKKERI